MSKTNRLLSLAGMLLALALPTSAQVNLEIGDLTLSPALFSGGNAIVQVPVFIEDMESLTRENNGVRSITFTLEITGDTNVIVGGVTANVTVANSYIGTLQAAFEPGIRTPGVDLENASGASTPDASGLAIHNQATQGSGKAADFPLGDLNIGGNWAINNTFDGDRKRGFVVSGVPGAIIGTTTAGKILIAVLEFEVVSGLDGMATAQLIVEANNDNANYNFIQFDDPGPGDTIDFDFAYPAGYEGVISFFEVPTCSGATVADDNGAASGSNIAINYEDITAGGNGGALTFSIPTGLAEQFVVTGNDGYSNTIAATPGTTTLSIDTANDASPDDTAASVTYTITPQVEFPPMSGTFVSGTSCGVSVSWAPTTCTATFAPTPVLGGNTDLDVVVINGRFNGVDYGTVTLPDMSTVALVAPNAAGNSLTFDNVVSIVGIDNGDVGTYEADVDGPGTNSSMCSDVLTLEPPDNQTNCASLTAAVIGGSVDITLAGNTGTVDFTVIYDGTTYDNLPAGVFNIPGIVGDNDEIVTRANGFDMMGNPTFDEVICTLDYVAPTCDSTTQNPDSTVTPVDVGTVITLTLVTSGAVEATIDGAPMATADDPDSNNPVTWTATHVAVADATITAVITNPDGETANCTWDIDINCVDPVIVSVGPVGSVGIVISGTVDCTYTVSITDANGNVTNYDVTVGPGGTGTLNVVIPPDAIIEVGQNGLPIATDSAFTVPTLGEWGLIAFIALLMGAGVVYMRRQRVA
jgi:hypothetical protein